MIDNLVLLHSTDAHVGYFDGLGADLAPGARFEHVVRNDWLDRAQSEGMTWQLRREIDNFVRSMDAPVTCTCATLGDAAEQVGAQRIDRPMMHAAARLDTTALLVCAQERSAISSLALLEEAMAAEGNDHAVLPLLIEQFWPLYLSGDAAGFNAAVAAAVIEAVEIRPDIGVVVLAQVSMAPATHLLDGLGVPVLSSPERAMNQIFQRYARASFGEPMTT